MEIDFDQSKSETNRRERGFGFGYAARVFLGRAIVFQDARADYGEIRMIAIGEIEGKLYKVVYPDRGEVRRIISAHRASRQEQRKWQQSD